MGLVENISKSNEKKLSLLKNQKMLYLKNIIHKCIYNVKLF